MGVLLQSDGIRFFCAILLSYIFVVPAGPRYTYLSTFYTRYTYVKKVMYS